MAADTSAEAGRIASLEQLIEKLKGYVQHKPECQKSTRETIDGYRVRRTPWDADQQACTCGLADLEAVLRSPSPDTSTKGT